VAAPNLPRYVDVPASPAPRFGLESVVTWLPADEARIFMGVQFEPLRCDAARLTSALQCFDDESPFGVPKETEAGVPLVVASPFAVYGEYECNPVGRPINEAYERARLHLERGRSRAMERAVQFGEAGNIPTLTADAIDITPGAGAVSLIDAIARIEQYLGANYGGTGVIHMDRRIAAHAITDYVLVNDGTNLRTHLGTLVAAGGGYTSSAGPNESPGESPGDGQLWIYGTGAVYGWMGEVGFIPDTAGGAINRSNNTLAILAEQPIIIAWECLTVAVQIDSDSLSNDVGIVL